jgi:hypothetical protein
MRFRMSEDTSCYNGFRIAQSDLISESMPCLRHVLVVQLMIKLRYGFALFLFLERGSGDVGGRWRGA